MKKILIVTPQVIIPPIDGGKKCMYHRIGKYSKYLHTSIVMANSDNYEFDIKLAKKTLDKVENIIVISRTGKRIIGGKYIDKIKEILKWFISGKPRQAQTIQSSYNKENISKFIIENKINIVIFETPFAAELVDVDEIKKNNVKIITIEHNVEFLFIKDCLERFKNISYLEIKRVKKYEKKVLEQSDKIIAISPLDKKKLKNEFNLSCVKYLPTYFEKENDKWKCEDSNYLVFCGSLSFYPNYHGIKWFVENVFNQYAKIYPLMKLKISGNVDAKIKLEFIQYPNVEFTGFISDENLKCILLKSFFTVVPILKGSGIKIKILEALSYGVPVVTTQHGADGIPYDFESPYLVGSNQEEFLENMILLTENTDARKVLGEKAQRFFEDVYASEKNIENWKDAILN